MRCYTNLVDDSTRVMSRVKAIYRGRAIGTSGEAVYRPSQRAAWLARLEGRGARTRAESLLAQLDVLLEELASVLALCDREQLFDVGQVFLATGRSLVSQKVIPTYEMDRQFVNHGLNARLPRRIEIDARNGGENIDAIGWIAQLDDLTWLKQIPFRNAGATEPECSQRAKNLLCVARRSADEEVDVTRVTRVPMKCHRVAADNEIFNVVRVQQYDELSQIGLQLRQVYSARAQSTQEGHRAAPQA